MLEAVERAWPAWSFVWPSRRPDGTLLDRSSSTRQSTWAGQVGLERTRSTWSTRLRTWRLGGSNPSRRAT